MTDPDALSAKLRESLGATRIEEQWNGTLVTVNFSGEDYDTLKTRLQTAFSGIEYEFSENMGYKKAHCALYAMGPGTHSSKTHRLQISMHDVGDDEALDDLGSYLAKDFSALVQPTDKCLVVIFDNGARYAY